MSKVIQCEFESATLIKRFPEQYLNEGTSLLVKNNQQALIFKDAQVFERFQEGKHLLEKGKKLSFIQRFFRKKADEDKYEGCSLVFINLRAMSDDWLIEDDFIVQDPSENLYLYLNIKGQISLHVGNVDKLMSTNIFSQSEDVKLKKFLNFMRAKMNIIIKERVYTAIMRDQITFTAMIKHLKSISEETRVALTSEFEEYGFKIENFLIEEIAPKKSFFDQVVTQQQEVIFNKQRIASESLKAIEMGKANAEARKAQGYTYQQERQFDILESLAHRRFINSISGEPDELGNTVDKEVGSKFGEAISEQISTNTEEAFKPKKSKN